MAVVGLLLVMAAATVTPVLLAVQLRHSRARDLQRLAELVSGWVLAEVDIAARECAGSVAAPVEALESATAVLLRPFAPPRVPARVGRSLAA